MVNNTQKIIDTLKQKINYLSKNEIKIIDKSIDFAQAKHQNQLRFSGEPYLNHLLSVAISLAEIKIDSATIVAGILHDTLEDTDTKPKEIIDQFGREVFNLVDGVTKVSQIRLKNIDQKVTDDEQYRQLESLRKLFLAMAKDLRVVLIKLADRLHNMQTLQYVPVSKQERIAHETMEIYVPLANRLGLWQIKSQLEDLAFKYVKPQEFIDIFSEVKSQTKKGKIYIEKIKKIIKKNLYKANIVNFRISGRMKNLYSIYLKTIHKNKSIDKIYDIYAVRIITKNIQDCYAVLGTIHTLWKPIPGGFKDYIAVPKPNGYQSLHTSVFADGGQKLEIQIRTEEMHNLAEQGIAAHWLYKEKNKTSGNLDWVSELSKVKNMDLNEFSDELKIDLFKDRIFVYTPKGDVKDLPIGSTPIDFAYNIHSHVGDSLVGAKVNQKIVPLDYELKNSDIVEILTSKVSLGPKRQWLELVKTSIAKNRIKAFFKKVNYAENVQEGGKILSAELKRLNLASLDNFSETKIKNLLDQLNYKKLNDLLVAISQGDVSVKKVIKILFPESEVLEHKKISHVLSPKKSAPTTIVFGNNQRLSYKLSNNCCQPKYPEKIIGYITRGFGLVVHRFDCKNVINKDPERFIVAHWDHLKESHYQTTLVIDCDNRVGMLHDISEVIMLSNLNLLDINVVQQDNNQAKINLIINLDSLDELTQIIKNISKLPGIHSVNRK